MNHLNKTNINELTKELEKIIKIKQNENNKRNFSKNIRVFNLIKTFIKKNNLLIYGGVAINSILPKKDRFYDKYEVPDIDFFSLKAKIDAINLADFLKKNGVEYVEVKSGIHYETFKVYVNFTPVVDITEIPKFLFNRMVEMSNKEIHEIKKIAPDYDIIVAPLTFLRLSIHIELSRPNGYIERWPKIFRRMTLLYNYYPVPLNKSCEGFIKESVIKIIEIKEYLIEIIKTMDLPLIGIEAVKLYLQKGGIKIDSNAILDSKMTILDIISTNYITTSDQLIKELHKFLGNGFKVYRKFHASLNKNELLTKHIIINIEYYENNKLHIRPIITIYKSNACYSYKMINNMMVASIDSNLSFLYAWLLTNRSYLKKDKIQCILEWLLNIQYINLHSKKYIFNLFERRCYGKQTELIDLKKIFWNKKSNNIIYRPNI